jgi:hypothetical protein
MEDGKKEKQIISPIINGIELASEFCGLTFPFGAYTDDEAKVR